MGSKKMEMRQKAESNTECGQEIAEVGELLLMEALEMSGHHCPIQVIDDENADGMPEGDIEIPTVHIFDTEIPDNVGITLKMGETQNFNEIAMEVETKLDDEFGMDITQFLESLDGIF